MQKEFLPHIFLFVYNKASLIIRRGESCDVIAQVLLIYLNSIDINSSRFNE